MIKAIPTIGELQAYWDTNKELQGNPDFKNLINARKKELKWNRAM